MSDNGTHSRFTQRYSASRRPSLDTSCAGWSLLALRMSLMAGVNGISASTYRTTASASTASSHSRPWADSQESGRRTSAAHSPAVRARKESKNTINVDKKCL